VKWRIFSVRLLCVQYEVAKSKAVEDRLGELRDEGLSEHDARERLERRDTDMT
jgi:hypothetical protein